MPKPRKRTFEITPEFLKKVEDLKRDFRESDRRIEESLKMARETLRKLELIRERG